jgi:preprotein translocase YajC subunit
VDVTVLTAPVLLAQAASEGLSSVVLPFVFLALLYVLLIRPQSKRRRELLRLVAALREGDLVVTLGGIHGEILKKYEDGGDPVGMDSVFRFFETKHPRGFRIQLQNGPRQKAQGAVGESARWKFGSIAGFHHQRQKLPFLILINPD